MVTSILSKNKKKFEVMFLNIKNYILVFLACFLFINIHNIKADDNDDQKTALKAMINAIFSKL